MATVSEIKALQTTVNRYSKVAGFVLLSIDGQVGKNTLTASYKALNWAARDYGSPNTSSALENALRLKAGELYENTSSTSALSDNATDITNVLSSLATLDNLPSVQAPAPTPKPGIPFVPDGTVISPFTPGNSASIWDAFKRLALWQQVAIAAGFAMGILWARKRYFAKPAKRSKRGG